MDNTYIEFIDCSKFRKAASCATIVAIIIVMSPFAITGQTGISNVFALEDIPSDEQEYYEFVSYENSTFGIYVEHPNDWEIITPSNVKGDRVLQIVQFWSPDGTGVVSISRDIFDTQESLTTYLAETIQSLRSSLSNFTLLGSDTIQTTLADNEGYSLVYSYNEDETGLTFLTSEVGTIIPGTDMVYFVEYNAPVRYYAGNELPSSQIVDSLEFHIQLPKTETGEPPKLGSDQTVGEVGEI